MAARKKDKPCPECEMRAARDERARVRSTESAVASAASTVAEKLRITFSRGLFKRLFGKHKNSYYSLDDRLTQFARAIRTNILTELKSLGVLDKNFPVNEVYYD